jgi:hypothetical protein
MNPDGKKLHLNEKHEWVEYIKYDFQEENKQVLKQI